MASESLRRFVDWAVSTARSPVPAIPVLPLTIDPRLLDPDILSPGRDRHGPI